MYIPEALKMTSKNEIFDFIDSFGFAVMISPSLQATHIPLLLNRKEGKDGTLYGHLARSNPHWQELQSSRVMAIFNGPHSYISPTWYAKQPSVPTWNYAAVHAFGKVELLSEPDTLNVLNQAIEKYEPELLTNEQVLNAEHNQRLAKAIVGFKIKVDELQGKLKLGQHRSQGDNDGVRDGLQRSGSLEAQQLVAFMDSRLKSL